MTGMLGNRGLLEDEGRNETPSGPGVRRLMQGKIVNRFGLASAGLVLASLSIWSAPVRAGDTSIGSAHQDVDGTLVLRLRAEAKDASAFGDGELRYAPADPDYGRVHRHLGAIPPGGEVPVRPFPKTWTVGPETVPLPNRPPK